SRLQPPPVLVQSPTPVAALEVVPVTAMPVSLTEHPQEISQPLKTLRRPPRAVMPTPVPPPAAPRPPAARHRPAAMPRLPEADYPRAEGLPPQELAAVPVAPPTRTPALFEGAERASEAVNKQLSGGRLTVEFTGTGHTGNMVEAQFSNRSKREMEVHLAPGIILHPPVGQKIQPLLLAADTVVRLGPGETRTVPLEAYCMNSQAPGPDYWQNVKYSVAQHPQVLERAAMQLLPALKRMQDKGLLQPPASMQMMGLAPDMYQRAVMQFAVWKALRQVIDEHVITATLGVFAEDRDLRKQIFRDVDSLLREAQVN
ncbi:unnamed protein product, partial [Phaeothamnion confervicola]